MKKFYFFPVFFTAFLLTACVQQPQEKQQPTSERTFAPITGTSSSSYAYTWQMPQPALVKMTNRTAMNEGYQEQWSTGFTLDVAFVENFTKSCFDNQYQHTQKITLTDGTYFRELEKSDIAVGNTLTLTGLRTADALLTLSEQQKQQVARRGRTIIPLDHLKEKFIFLYDRESASRGGFDEEWVRLITQLGGKIDVSQRHPFNTVLITNDLLLHIYHKLFDNSLKYYEENIARPTLVTLSEKFYKQYLNLIEQEKAKGDNTVVDEKTRTSILVPYYEFLAAYRAIPHIFLPSNQELIDQVYDKNGWETDLTDEQIVTLIRQRTKTIAKTLTPTYQYLIPQIVEKILKADEERANDDFLAVMADDYLLSLSEKVERDTSFHLNETIKRKEGDIIIQQDYTQFKPRAHYMDSSFLKTYFMAMKWLMREKFYFGSQKLTQTAMVMVSTIKEEDLQELNQLTEQITNLIGIDDDVTLNEMKTYLQQYRRISSPTASLVTAADWENIRKELSALHPQNIQSTHYQTNCIECVGEEDAKSITDGFVFFGEKFTLDSYLFDLMTAGSAEKEFAYKPNQHTAFMVPDLLEDNALANQLVTLWLQEKAAQGTILQDTEHTQVSSYAAIKSEAKAKLTEIAQNPLITANIYHKRLQLLGLLLKAPLENAPYRHFDPLYQLKSLITYMGSYTELKHDTLLYVKQSYAEMGGAGGNSCEIYLETPIPPVPKGYVEAEPDFIDQLIALNTETLPYFKGTYEQQKFIEFGKILEKLKEISIKQMRNEVISDEDFERLRLIGERGLRSIVYSMKTFGITSQGEMRGALITDVFTSEGDGPLYEATGRPALMLVMVDDVNGARVVIGPVFTHYEFYQSDGVIPSSDTSRYTDRDWQEQLHQDQPQYDNDRGERVPTSNYTMDKGLSIASRELKKGLEETE